MSAATLPPKMALDSHLEFVVRQEWVGGAGLGPKVVGLGALGVCNMSLLLFLAQLGILL